MDGIVPCVLMGCPHYTSPADHELPHVESLCRAIDAYLDADMSEQVFRMAVADIKREAGL